MRFLVTLVMALVLSCLAGAATAVILAEWANGDESYILVFMAIPLAVAVAAVSFLIAGTRPNPRGAIRKVGIALLALLAALFVWMTLLTLSYGLESYLTWRSEKLTITICVSMLAVVVTQWLIFRWRIRPAAGALAHFGRGPGEPA